MCVLLCGKVRVSELCAFVIVCKVSVCYCVCLNERYVN